jgi:NADPH:quinone reductase-like Zn-dependent oxidoreductase
MKAHALQSADKPASLIEIEKPKVGGHDVLVAVKAASVNGFDVYQASGYLTGMMEHALPTTIGRDFAGIVAAVGAEVRDFAAGDEVFGFIPSVPPLKSGAFAEYVVGGTDLVLARKPAGLDFEAAAGLPLAGSAALDVLDAIDGKAGDVVLVVGATGGVGSFVVQLGTQRGWVMVATARPSEEPYIRELGASDTIDYSAGSVAVMVRRRYPDGVAALIDLVDQKDALAELATIVHSGGEVATLLGAADLEALAARGITGHNVNARPTVDKLRMLGELAASGALRVPIQGVYPIDRTSEALAEFQKGTLGKLIVAI